MARLIFDRSGEASAVKPTDSIAVQMKAASESLRYFKKETTDDFPVPQLLSRNIDSESNTTLFSELQSTVQTLQETNNILLRRYENALLNSQSTILTSDFINNKSSEGLEFWERMLRDAESQSVANFDAFLVAKKKLDEVSMQGSSGTKESNTRQSVKAASNDRQLLLEKEIAANKKKLADFKALKKKRIISAVKIGNFLLKYFYKIAISSV